MTKESPQFPEDFPNDLDIPDRDAIVASMSRHSQDTSPSPTMSSDDRLQAIADAYRLFIVVSDRGEAHTPEARQAFEKVLTALDTLIDRDALTEKCICVKFKDTGGFQIADLTCPIHGIDGTSPGDWQEDSDE